MHPFLTLLFRGLRFVYSTDVGDVNRDNEDGYDKNSLLLQLILFFLVSGGFVPITKVFKSTYVHLHRMLDYFTCYNSDNSSFELRSRIQQEPLSIYGRCTSMLKGVKQRNSSVSTMLPITLRWPPRPIMCSCKPFSEDGYGLGSSSNLRWPGCSCFGTLCARDWFVGLLKRWGTKKLGRHSKVA